jgi:hypothetical protein
VRRTLGWAGYAALLVVALLMVTSSLDLLLPRGTAVRLSRSSEGFVAAAVLVPWVLLVRSRRPHRLPAAVVVGAPALMAVIGVALYVTNLPSPVRTLNETALALAVLMPWTAARRPVPRWTSGAIAAVGALGIVLAWLTSQPLVVTFTEAYAMLLVAVLTFELVEPHLLDPQRAPRPTAVRVGWLLLLVAAALATTLMDYPAGEPETLARVLSRGCEGYVALGATQLLLFLLTPAREPSTRHAVTAPAAP